jgi:hypothetical protein
MSHHTHPKPPSEDISLKDLGGVFLAFALLGAPFVVEDPVWGIACTLIAIVVAVLWICFSRLGPPLKFLGIVTVFALCGGGVYRMWARGQAKEQKEIADKIAIKQKQAAAQLEDVKDHLDISAPMPTNGNPWKTYFAVKNNSGEQIGWHDVSCTFR